MAGAKNRFLIICALVVLAAGTSVALKPDEPRRVALSSPPAPGTTSPRDVTTSSVVTLEESAQQPSAPPTLAVSRSSVVGGTKQPVGTPSPTAIATRRSPRRIGHDVPLLASIDGDTHLVSPDGSDRQNLGVTGYSAISPDGSFLAGVRRDALVILSMADRKIQRLHQAPSSSPSFSPEGSRIAFTLHRGTGPAGRDVCLSTIQSDGAHVRCLYESNSTNFSARWSADSSRLYLVSSLSDGSRLMSIDAASGADLRVVIDATVGGFDVGPENQIVFSRQAPGQSYPELWTANGDGSGQQKLVGGSDAGSDPVWSPDGQRIAFAAPRAADDPPRFGIRTAQGQLLGYVDGGQVSDW